MPANNRSAVSGGLNLSLESLGVNLPYSMEAEQAVLGAAILDADIIPKMVETLRPEMFCPPERRDILRDRAPVYRQRACGFCHASGSGAGCRCF